ncbi:HAD family hydrolase [Shewanella sp.]|uniref:HAD family hydrolase n=1 Tax=Shewanella sp. TaxID=50422 RepID=UPI0040480E0D
MALAVLFDLDGVISDTAVTHAQAWKAVFDQVLSSDDSKFTPFDEKIDYLRYVDGKSRQAGIADFLASRGIHLPMGDAIDSGIDSIQGIGNTKNAVFRALLETAGVKIFPDALRAIEKFRAGGVELGLASSSKNARLVLEKAGLSAHFKSILDGMVAEAQGVASKPDPAFYRCAANLVGRDPSQCIVFEDAISGVMSAKLAGAGCVVGVSRQGNENSLKEHGADIVLETLDELDTYLGDDVCNQLGALLLSKKENRT